MAHRKLIIGEKYNFLAHANRRDNQPNLILEKGCAYTFEVIQIIEDWKDVLIPSKLTGFNFYIVKHIFRPRKRDSKYMALCGCIAFDSNEHMFEIGEGLANYKVPITGQLSVFANDYDTKCSYGNNKGLVEMRILRVE